MGGAIAAVVAITTVGGGVAVTTTVGHAVVTADGIKACIRRGPPQLAASSFHASSLMSPLAQNGHGVMSDWSPPPIAPASKTQIFTETFESGGGNFSADYLPAPGRSLEAGGKQTKQETDQAATVGATAVASASNAVEMSRMLMTPIRL